VDLVSARRETYSAPAELPKVFPSGLLEDLRRRDFTVNAMAFGLLGSDSGQIIDPFGGRKDLASRRLRVLHERSILDDPTRAFRAVRYSLRLGFSVDATLRRLIREAIDRGAVARLSGDRLRREIELLFEEAPAGPAVAALKSLGLHQTLSAGFQSGRRGRDRLKRFDRVGSNFDASRSRALLLVWSLELPDGDVAALVDRLAFRGRARAQLLRFRERVRQARAILGRSRALGATSALVVTWEPEEAWAAAAALPAPHGRKFLEAFSRGRRTRLSITGSDLKRSGIAAGPAIGRALAETWKARLEKRIPKSKELAFALEEARR
jgi:tRNA nucleotidyltransferase (CCA-adding enzyme)